MFDTHFRDLLKSGLTWKSACSLPSGKIPATSSPRESAQRFAYAETVICVFETGVPHAAYDATASEFTDTELADLTLPFQIRATLRLFSALRGLEPTTL